MSEFKILHNTQKKNNLKELIKKIFLKLLKIIFPKKFPSYKERIKNLVLKIRIKILGSNIGFDQYLYFFFQHILIRLKYPSYFKLPYNHLRVFHTLNKFLEILRSQNINFFLVEGSLLGAVRQGCIAGSASDIDLGIKEDELPKLLKSISVLKKRGVNHIRQWPHDKCERIQFFFGRDLIDVGVYRRKNIENKEVWIGESEMTYDKKFYGIPFPIEDLNNLKPIQFYATTFLAPSNPELYLEKKYGKNWRIPDKKQFFFKKNKNLF
tara:strand:+ start:1102 stop:1899 length:798 start_codon:yes stop_codon:yes gene_type:complete